MAATKTVDMENLRIMTSEDIKEVIFDFVSTHEAIISNDTKNRDEDIVVRFTTFGNRAACKALYDVIQILDDDTKLKTIEMMKNKRVSSSL